MRVPSEQIVTAASRPGAPSVPAVRLRQEAPDLTALMRRPAWMADALCREYPNIDFLGESKAARRVCRECSVREQCRAYGREDVELIDGSDCARGGIWGGLSASDRRRLRAGLPVVDRARKKTTKRAVDNGLLCGQVCQALNVSPAAVRAMAAAGTIPWHRGRSGQRLYSRAAVEAMRETMAHEAPATPPRPRYRPPVPPGPVITRPDHLTTAEVARLFGVSTKTVARWADDGRLPYALNERLVRCFPRDQARRSGRRCPTAEVEQPSRRHKPRPPRRFKGATRTTGAIAGKPGRATLGEVGGPPVASERGSDGSLPGPGGLGFPSREAAHRFPRRAGDRGPPEVSVMLSSPAMGSFST